MEVPSVASRGRWSRSLKKLPTPTKLPTRTHTHTLINQAGIRGQRPLLLGSVKAGSPQEVSCHPQSPLIRQCQEVRK